ncbi:hypothetical protein KHP62_06725 [Rhodobacteraceae bacterium NNCM2]|nr:hypothetical protein [Coraliihabitans acroporae]
MRIFALLAALPLLTAPAAHADEISETIQAALEAYEAGDISLAKEELDFANQLLGQLKAEGLTAYLPEAMAGWTREDAESQSVGAAAFGGGLMAEANYSNGSDDLSIRLMAENPMVSAMGAAFGNSALMGSMGTVKRINRQKLVIGQDGQIQSLIDGKVLVQIDGSASVEDKLAYFELLDIDGLKAF